MWAAITSETTLSGDSCYLIPAEVINSALSSDNLELTKKAIVNILMDVTCLNNEGQFPILDEPDLASLECGKAFIFLAKKAVWGSQTQVRRQGQFINNISFVNFY